MDISTEEITHAMQDVEQLQNDEQESPAVRRLAAAVRVVLRHRADQMKRAQQPAANGGDLENAPTDAAPPPLTSSIPPGLYEAPRGADGQPTGPALSSMYEAPRNADGTVNAANGGEQQEPPQPTE